MLFLADNLAHARLAEVRERLIWMLQEVVTLAGGSRCHRRRQVDEPPGIDREPAHDLQGGTRTLRVDRDATRQLGLDVVLARDVAELQQLRRPSGGLTRGGSDRLVVLTVRGDRDQFPFRPAHRSELTAEHRTGVEADRVVEPASPRHRRVAVHDRRVPPVILSPLVAHRQTELVGLPVGIAIQRERAHTTRRATVIALGQACMGDDEATAVEDVVADEPVDELGDLAGKLGAAPIELLERLGKPMGHLDVAASQGTAQLVLVVAEDAERAAASNH